jgi:hypothetical protein
LKPLLPVAQSGSPFLWEEGDQLIQERLHTPHDLYAGGTVDPDLVKGQAKKILPRWKLYQQPWIALRVAKRTNFQATAAQAN